MIGICIIRVCSLVMHQLKLSSEYSLSQTSDEKHYYAVDLCQIQDDNLWIIYFHPVCDKFKLENNTQFLVYSYKTFLYSSLKEFAFKFIHQSIYQDVMISELELLFVTIFTQDE